MQSSLRRFMKRVEDEKEAKRKRLHPDSCSEGERGVADTQSANNGVDGKRQKIEAGGKNKLYGFSHTPKTSSHFPTENGPSTSTTSEKKSNPMKDCNSSNLLETEKSPRGTRSTKSTKDRAKSQYTPLEQQYLSIKASHPDAVLFVECGYRYRFFDEDAEVASKVLKIGCFPDHNFNTASIPTYRLNIHLRRLVAAGYKVGVVKQMETAALKAASGNKSGPFTRELTGLYTRSTLIGPDVEEEDGGSNEGGVFLMCISELASTKSIKRKDKETTIGFLAVQPAAGNMIYDEFQDRVDSLSELETRLSHIQPVELLLPNGSSKRLEQMLTDWKLHGRSDSKALRIEKLPQGWFEYNKAFSTVSEFYGRKTESDAEAEECCDTLEKAEALQVAINLPSTSLSCLSGLIHHLKPFNLQRVLSLTSNMQPFGTGMHCMRLTSRTLSSLEIFKNQSDASEKGTLFWVLNHTQTPFGKRLLFNWICYPLKDISKIKMRQEAVSELSQGEKPTLSLLKVILTKLPDLERKLCSAYHKKCSPAEFHSLIKTLNCVSHKLDSFSEMALSDLKSKLLLNIIKEIPTLLRGVDNFLENLCETAAKEGNYENLFTKAEQFPNVLREKTAISDSKQKLKDHRKLFRRTLSDHTLDYVTVSGDQYLVEVKNKEAHKVPANWLRVSRTKLVTRFRPPYVTEALKELTQHHDQLLLHAKTAWDSVLDDFSSLYGGYKRAVDLLASADCLISLSEVAKMPGYTCPDIVEEQVIEIKEGRHPIIDLLFEGGQYVANDTSLDVSRLRSMIITGPNMGGKSSYIKQVALICVLGQVGSHVPARTAKLGVLDGIYTRMGAYDNIFSGKSTFMMELMEAAEIMKLSTERSLVIMDELGRGTSTHDGTAIAYATLAYFIESVKCLTLFVTHYPLIGELEIKYPSCVANFHMAYVQVDTAEEDFDKVIFLYHLDRGQANASYGLNVASLAGLSSGILQLAHSKSKQLEIEVQSKLSSKPLGKDLQVNDSKVSQSVAKVHSLLKFLNSPHCDNIKTSLQTYIATSEI